MSSAPAFYLYQANEVTGPFDEQQLRDLKTSGELEEEAYFCREGDEEWRSIAELPEAAPSQEAGENSAPEPSAPEPEAAAVRKVQQPPRTPEKQRGVGVLLIVIALIGLGAAAYFLLPWREWIASGEESPEPAQLQVPVSEESTREAWQQFEAYLAFTNAPGNMEDPEQGLAESIAILQAIDRDGVDPRVVAHIQEVERLSNAMLRVLERSNFGDPITVLAMTEEEQQAAVEQMEKISNELEALNEERARLKTLFGSE